MVSPLLYNVQPADKRNYQTSKKASLWFRAAEDATDDTKWGELGNIVDPTMKIQQTLLEHFSNRRGQRAIDRTELTDQQLSLDFSIEEITITNLLKAFGGAAGKSSSTVKIREHKILKNPGGGKSIDLKMEDIDAGSAVVRQTALEGSPTTFEADPFTTDTTDDTADGSFNNTTNPLTVAGFTGDYPNSPATVGAIIKIASEYLKITAVAGADVTFSRGAAGSTAAVHADGVSIFKQSATGDYLVNVADGEVEVLLGGSATDKTAEPELSIYWTKEVETEKFSIFDGTTISGEAQLQILTKKGARLVLFFPSVEIRNNGDVSFGTGQDWIRIPLQFKVLADEEGAFGEKHVINADQELAT